MSLELGTAHELKTFLKVIEATTMSGTLEDGGRGRYFQLGDVCSNGNHSSSN